MKPLFDEMFVCIDCESTGLDPLNDRIVEVAVALFTFQELFESYETLIDPKCDIPQVSQEIHKISAEMVKGKPSIESVLPRILTMIGTHTIVGHGVFFDIQLIASAAKRGGIETSLLHAPYIDTLRLARLYGESPSNSLQQLREHFNIAPEGAHRAMSDVIVNIEVFKHLSKKFKTLAEVKKALEKPIKLKTMPLGKHKGRRFDEIPIEYLIWAEKKDFDQDLLFSIRSAIKERKRGGGFEVASNPFSNL